MYRYHTIGYDRRDSTPPPEEYWKDALTPESGDWEVQRYVNRQRVYFDSAWLEYIDEDDW